MIFLCIGMIFIVDSTSDDGPCWSGAKGEVVWGKPVPEGTSSPVSTRKRKWKLCIHKGKNWNGNSPCTQLYEQIYRNLLPSKIILTIHHTFYLFCAHCTLIRQKLGILHVRWLRTKSTTICLFLCSYAILLRTSVDKFYTIWDSFTDIYITLGTCEMWR